MSTQSDPARDIPCGWASATVGTIADYINGLAFKPSDWGRKGRPIIRIQNLTGQSDHLNLTTRDVDPIYVVQPGTILVSWSATLDVFVWRGPEAVLNQHIFKVVPVAAMSDQSFVRWALKNAIDEMWRGEHTHGTTMRHINRGPFLAHRLNLPPAREQVRIADAIDSYVTRLDAAAGSLERVQAKLKSYRASVLKAAVEGRLVPTEASLARAEKRVYEPADMLLKRILKERRRRWEEAEVAKLKAGGKTPKDNGWKARYPEPVAPDTSTLRSLPEGWCWATVDMVADVGTGSTPSRTVPSYWDGGAVPWVTSAAATQNVVLEASECVTQKAVEQARLTLYPAGTLIVALYGEGKTRGRCSVLGIASTINQALGALVTSGLAEQLREWLRLFMQFNYDNLRRESSGGVQPNLNLSIVKRIAFPLPPVAEQQRAVVEWQRLRSVDDVVAAELNSQSLRMMRLRQSILKWAFEGKLVDQDPSDEPAEELLARIRAEYATEAPTKNHWRRKARTVA